MSRQSVSRPSSMGSGGIGQFNDSALRRGTYVNGRFGLADWQGVRLQIKVSNMRMATAVAELLMRLVADPDALEDWRPTEPIVVAPWPGFEAALPTLFAWRDKGKIALTEVGAPIPAKFLPRPTPPRR